MIVCALLCCNLPISDIRLDETEHLLCGTGDLDKDTVVYLE